MPPRTQLVSPGLAEAIMERRQALGLSIQEAAARAGMTSKTWSSYEGGSSMRADKVRGLCKALGWRVLPETDTETYDGEDEDDHILLVGEEHPAFSSELENQFGHPCTVAFAIGSDIIMGHAQDDLRKLRSQPRGTHVGQLEDSWLDESLPPQFVPRYDYEFVYALTCAIASLRERFAIGVLVAYSVLEEIALHLIFAETELLADLYPGSFAEGDDWIDWLGSILGDLDVRYVLFQPGRVLTTAMSYHFDHWLEDQFWTDGQEQSPEEILAAQLGLLAPESASGGSGADADAADMPSAPADAGQLRDEHYITEDE